MESRRQSKVSSLLREVMSEVLQKHGANYYGAAFVTITAARVTPDLLTARFYLSVYNLENKQDAIDGLRRHVSDIRRHLGNRIKNHMRRVPELEFFLDDTLDDVFRIDELLKKDPPKDVEVDPDDYEEDIDD